MLTAAQTDTGATYQRAYAGIQYGLSGGFYTREDAMCFLAELDNIRLREASSRARGDERELRALQHRLDRLQEAMRQVRLDCGSAS